MKIEKEINLFKQNIPETKKKKNQKICEKVNNKVLPLSLSLHSRLFLFSDYCPRVKRKTYHFVFFHNDFNERSRFIDLFGSFLKYHNINSEGYSSAEENDSSTCLSENEFKKLETVLGV